VIRAPTFPDPFECLLIGSINAAASSGECVKNPLLTGEDSSLFV
jgi:hypothetical protein